MDGIVFNHYSVMLRESISALNIRPDGIYVDGTAGGGGHSYAIAEKLTEGGRLIAIDQDEDALAACRKRLSPFEDRVTLVKSNFSALDAVLKSLSVPEIDGFLIDAGVSSFQLDTAERGFSYQQDAPLDMRMDRQRQFTAYDVVNGYSVEELKRILYDYGEEKFSPRIAEAIVREREVSPIETTGRLADIIRSAIPAAARDGGHHPAKRSFQAIRIEVNRELDVIEPAIRSAVSHMRKGGRVAVITFHSLEDRIVKNTFSSLSQGCTCPRDFPVCICGKKPTVKTVEKKPILPTEQELNENPRSRSAKLRVAEKL